ncbi:hypothetical protein KSP40_PGU007976 [Platanthera guangdongensis]|uniref:Gelsolin-like domain-containing protein n=1 Tax=Platanthera guangdongensis TaxID=2320717 RepID=A0ABR2N105_9ASPA
MYLLGILNVPVFPPLLRMANVEERAAAISHATKMVDSFKTQTASSLNSSYCYILHSGNTLFTWSGNLTNAKNQELVKRQLDIIKPQFGLLQGKFALAKTASYRNSRTLSEREPLQGEQLKALF